MAESLREVDLLGTTVEYEVCHSSDATEPRIDVDIHGVTVVLPDVADVRPIELLKQNAAWVVEKKREYDIYREQAPERQFEEGASFPYLGDPYEIIVDQRPYSSVVNDTFRLAEYHVENTSIRRALENLYRRNARQRFERRADHFAKEMGVGYNAIELRNQRTRWGSCSTNGTLSFNWRLMMAPPNVIDYIIIHELAHLIEQNHNDHFWSLVAEQDPNYLDHAQWLTDHSTQLIFSKADL